MLPHKNLQHISLYNTVENNRHAAFNIYQDSLTLLKHRIECPINPSSRNKTTFIYAKGF